MTYTKITWIVFREEYEHPDGTTMRWWKIPEGHSSGRDEGGVWFWSDASRTTRITIPWTSIAWIEEEEVRV